MLKSIPYSPGPLVRVHPSSFRCPVVHSIDKRFTQAQSLDLLNQVRYNGVLPHGLLCDDKFCSSDLEDFG